MMGTKWNLAVMEVMYKKSLYLYKGELPQARGVWSMEMWDSFPVENFIVPILCIQIVLGGYYIRKLIVFVNSHLQNSSKREKVAHNTMVTVKQVISKRRQELQLWYVKDGVMFQQKAIQLKWLQDIKKPNPGLNNDIGISIT